MRPTRALMGEQLARPAKFNLDLVESARLWRWRTLSMGDALISDTNNKNFYNFWRPVTAIQKLGLDTNWTPFLGATIGNQEYPAGHPMVSGGAGVGILELLFGSGPLVPPLEITTFPSLPALCPNPTRTFTSLKAARLDVVSARVWGGIHFRGSGMEGMRTGQRLARWLNRHYLLPLPSLGWRPSQSGGWVRSCWLDMAVNRGKSAMLMNEPSSMMEGHCQVHG